MKNFRRVVLVATFALAGCSSSPNDQVGTTIDITLSDLGCSPEAIVAESGPVTFVVTNEGSAAVTEFEILKEGRIVGEVENVIPGVDQSLSLTLGSGEYRTKCPGGSANEGGTLTMTASEVPTSAGT